MPFYQKISPWYDEIFPVDEQEVAFITDRIAGREHLLDIGCGTGNKTAPCSAAVKHTTAFDADAGMIAAARSNHARPGIDYIAGTMETITAIAPSSSFDCALCLGNTLVHLEGPEAIENLLADTFRLLQSGGRLILQILNYDRILDENVTALPPLENDHIVFSRRYAQYGSRLRFITTLADKQNSSVIDNEVLLYPLRRDELTGILDKCGFTPVIWYGSYREEAHTPASFVTIAVCEKP